MTGGQALVAGLLTAANKVGVEMWRNPLKELVQDASGRVTGVIVEGMVSASRSTPDVACCWVLVALSAIRRCVTSISTSPPRQSGRQPQWRQYR
jgi:hypothetical protein